MDAQVLSYRPSGGGVIADLDRLVASRMLLQANSGGGKSRALRQLLEETHGRVQHLVLDPEGEFATLREKFDYVLAGKEGDVPATPKTAKLLCRRLVEVGASAVIDLYDLSLHERREFVKLFLTELMNLPRALWRPILVVIDEAHIFCPERGSGESQSTDAVITLCTQGRKRGFAAVLATQRISKLHKDAAAELLNKLIGRTGLDVDMKRAGDELGLDKEGRRALAQLKPGEFYAYGPAIATEIQVVTTGTVVTTHPEAGRLSAAPPPAPAKVRAVLAQFADLPQEAEEEAKTVEDLRRQLRETQGKLRKAEKSGVEKIIEKPVADPRAIERAVTAAVKPYEQRIARLQMRLLPLVQAVGQVAEKLEAVATEVSVSGAEQVGEARTGMVRPSVVSSSARVVDRSSRAPARSTPPARPAAEAPEGVSPSMQRILNALAALEALGIAPAKRVNVAFFAGYTENGHFNNMLGSLRTMGLLDYPSGAMVQLTDAGRAGADAGAGSLSSLEDLHRVWLGKVSPSEARLLGALIERYPEPIERSALAEATGYTENGHFNNMLGHLRTLGAADYPGNRLVVATDVLFPEGLD